MKRFRAFLVVPLMFMLLLQAHPAQAWEVWTTSPWLALVTRFIGGVFVTVHPIETWNAEGETVRKEQINKIKKQSRIVAIDVADASRLGLKSPDWEELAFLYQRAPFAKDEADHFFSDPSALPFIAQRVFSVLSQFDPDNYSYYQRRLSEFQTRLDSTVIVGRSLLAELPLLYIGGSFSGMLTAAGCTLLPVDEEVKDSWSRGEELERIHSLAEVLKRKKILLLSDISPQKKVRDSLKNNKNILFLERPTLDQDLLLFFHGQYILLWNRVAALSQPDPAPSKIKKP